MQSIGRRYVQFVNTRRKRCGTLWQGRHHGSLIQSERYLLTCYRYVEMNPVAAGMVSDPADYRWSSYACNALGGKNPVITPHDLYTSLGIGTATRHDAYRELVAAPIPTRDLDMIRTATRLSLPIGDRHFHNDVERRLGRPLGQAKQGPRNRRARSEKMPNGRDD
jgi:putative transposase